MGWSALMLRVGQTLGQSMRGAEMYSVAAMNSACMRMHIWRNAFDVSGAGTASSTIKSRYIPEERVSHEQILWLEGTKGFTHWIFAQIFMWPQSR